MLGIVALVLAVLALVTGSLTLLSLLTLDMVLLWAASTLRSTATAADSRLAERRPMSTLAPYPLRVEGHLEQPSPRALARQVAAALPHYVVLGLPLDRLRSSPRRSPRSSSCCSPAATRGVSSTSTSACSAGRGASRSTRYGANGTDRYPPFTLADAPGYPARLEIAYPERQRARSPADRLVAARHPALRIVGVFLGGGGLAWRAGVHWPGGGVGVIVLVSPGLSSCSSRGSTRAQLFDFILGLNRWALRVAAFAALLTPVYPPFRLDAGEEEPGGVRM